MTLLMFPLLVYLAYLADKGFPCRTPKVVDENGKQIELGAIHPGECKLNWIRLFPVRPVPAAVAAAVVRCSSAFVTKQMIRLFYFQIDRGAGHYTVGCRSSRN